MRNLKNIFVFKKISGNENLCFGVLSQSFVIFLPETVDGTSGDGIGVLLLSTGVFAVEIYCIRFFFLFLHHCMFFVFYMDG